MLKFMISPEGINSNSDFSFIKKMSDRNVRMKDWDAELPAAHNSCYSTSTIGLMTISNSNYTNIEMFRFDFLFHKIANGEIPSLEIYRQRLDALAEKDG
ncbi:MAG: hypothetical protein WCS73_03430 [Lentisphaeria bacterium]